MIPIKLRLRNFMCYRDAVPELHLEGLHIACLCGPNGSGKSALLDSITWALWGKSRTRTSDDLIAVGCDEMEVELDFLVQSTTYRVLRKRERGTGRRPGKTLLEFLVSSGETFEPLTLGKQGETQAQIVETLRMDYETFINSAFLVQGRADEFTLKSADKRKEVLSEILNLTYYDAIAERAREQSRQRQTETESYSQTLQDLDVELAQRDEHEKRAEEAKSALMSVEGERQKLDEDLQRLKGRRVMLQDKQRRLEETKARMKTLTRELGELQQTHAAAVVERTVYENKMAERIEVEAGFQKLKDVVREKDHLEGQERIHLNLAREKAEQEGALAKARSEASAELRLMKAKLTELEERASELDPARAGLVRTEQRLADLAGLKQSLEAARQRIEESARTAGQLAAQNKQLRAEMEGVKTKMEQLRVGGGVCSLCGTKLSEDRCDGVLDAYKSEGTEKGNAFRENQARAAALQKEEAARRSEAETLEARLRSEEPALQAEIVTFKRMMDEAGKSSEQLAEHRVRVEQHEQRLHSGIGIEEEKALERIVKRIAELAYSEEARQAVKEAFESLRLMEGKHQALREAERLLPGVVDRLRQAEASITVRETDLTKLREEEKEFALELAEMPEMAAGLEKAEKASADASADQERLTRELGAAEAQLLRLDELALRRAERSKAFATASDEKGVFDELALAFGRKGVQALIIETAIPEIEEEANRLLARMTDNRMHLTLETQTGYRSREGVQETLDIRIADELGTRGYELFSGGEAFRINLALRIALSKMLARRAGAPLPTLFIDEGFGTQDPAGRDRIVDALNAIRDDFERIIVITHIDELKEQFPARIQVDKGPAGSTFSLS